MDAIISSAVEEICLEGAAGVALPRLWTLLLPTASASDLPLCDDVKLTAWNRLLVLPGLRFEAAGAPVSPNDPKISLPAAAEKIGVKVIAEEHIRDSCLGIQELKAGGKKFPDVQRRILERIALSRGNGLTQDQLGKELGLHGKEIFYYLKGLESNGVIVRQSTIVKKGISIVNTNSLFLTRYAGKRLNSNPHLRVEIMRGEATDAFENVDEEPSVAGDEVEEDVSMRDYLPAMEAICNMLEQSSGKVLVVSDIKRELGYRKTKGHRLWRNILNRLKHAKLVEEFQAKVNVDKQRNGRDRKPNICLRLLKKFNAKDFQPKNVTFGYDNSISENYVQHENRKGQDSELVMELPLDHQIYDMIEREGSNGIFVTEVYRRLGINGKKTYPRILDMRSRFKMPMTAECSNRTKVYRIWTFGNNPCDGSRTNIANCNDKQNPNTEIYAENELNSCSRQLSNVKDGIERRNGNSECVKTSGIIPQFDSSSGQICDVDISKISLPERSSSVLTTSLKIQPFQRHPCLDLSNVTLQRKERIISRLEEVLYDRPRVISEKVKHAWELPDNTFGAAYARFMGSRNFSPDDRPPVRFMDSEELAYVATRSREVHDFWHVLFGLPTNLIGESALKVVEFEQMLLPMCFLSVLGGTARFSEKQRILFFQHYFPWASRAGLRCTDLISVYYEKHFEEDLEDVRRRWSIIPFPDLKAT